MKRIPWFEITLIVIVMSISLYAALSDSQNLPQNWFMRDDAYYYFKVAQNISEGHGSTFDGINPTNGYHPLWMIICIPIFALARFDLILPLRILLLVMSGLSVATGILFYRLLGKIFTPFIGALAAIYWVFDIHVLNAVYKQGLETGLAALCIVLLLYNLYEFEINWRTTTFTKQQLIKLSLLAALTMFSRLDLVFLAGMAGLWIIFRNHPLRYYLPLDLIAIIVSVLLAFTIKFDFPAYFEHANNAMIMIGVALFVRLPAAYFTGLHQNPADEKPQRIIAKLTIFTLISSTIISVVMLGLASTLKFDSMPRTIFIMDAIFSFIAIGIIRFIHRDLRPTSNTSKVETPLDTLRANWKQWLTEGFIYYSIIVGLLGLYMLWNKIVIGTASPVSGQIKRWWGTFLTSFYGKYPRDILSFFGINATGDETAWQPMAQTFENWSQRLVFLTSNETSRYLIVLFLFVVVSYIILRSNKQKATAAIAQATLVPLFCSCILQVISYQAPGYAAEKEWYWVGELITIVLFISLLTGVLFDYVPPSYKHAIGWGVTAALGLSLGLSFWKTVQTAMPYGYWQPDAPYDVLVPIAEANTAPGSIIGMTGGGTTAYFIKDRIVVNMDGLINSEQYFKEFQNRTANEYLYNLGLDYVFANPYILTTRPYLGMFDSYLEKTGIEYSGFQLMKYDQPR